MPTALLHLPACERGLEPPRMNESLQRCTSETHIVTPLLFDRHFHTQLHWFTVHRVYTKATKLTAQDEHGTSGLLHAEQFDGRAMHH